MWCEARSAVREVVMRRIEDGVPSCYRWAAMSRPFPVYAVPLSPDAKKRAEVQEVMGSKPKFWLINRVTGRQVLWKQAREGSGEDWSEKVAYHIARRLGASISQPYEEQTAFYAGISCIAEKARNLRGEGGSFTATSFSLSWTPIIQSNKSTA